jgi:hypothetical protein
MLQIERGEESFPWRDIGSSPLHPFLALIIIGGLITTNLWLYFNL